MHSPNKLGNELLLLTVFSPLINNATNKKVFLGVRVPGIGQFPAWRLHNQVSASRYGNFPDGDLNEAARAADATRA